MVDPHATSTLEYDEPTDAHRVLERILGSGCLAARTG